MYICVEYTVSDCPQGSLLKVPEGKDPLDVAKEFLEEERGDDPEWVTEEDYFEIDPESEEKMLAIFSNGAWPEVLGDDDFSIAIRSCKLAVCSAFAKDETDEE